MTPSELLALADAATPGPWALNVEGGDGLYDEESEWIATFASTYDSRLAALAPDLARLCAEMGETLERYVDQPVGTRFHDPDEAFAVLAKLSELEPR